MGHPDYDREKYTVWALPNGMMIHWLLNPVLAFNELFLGQCIPKVMLVDRTDDRPLVERTYVPCPHCETLQSSLLWGKGNAFGHWFGYICPTCGELIPRLWNWTSLLLLTITFPIWIIPVSLLKPRWLAYEKFRIDRQLTRHPAQIEAVKKINWIFRGVFMWGGLMWIFMSVVPFLYSCWKGEGSFAWFVLMLCCMPICLGGGLLWGLAMRSLMNRKGQG